MLALSNFYNEYLFSIYRPYKVLGINAIKFSCIITHQTHQEFFDIWTDWFAGGLSLSSEMTITHFLTDNYECMLKKGMEYIHQNYCSYTSAPGVYMTIIIKNVSFEISTQHSFIKSLIENATVFLLPGYLEGFSESFSSLFDLFNIGSLFTFLSFDRFILSPKTETNSYRHLRILSLHWTHSIKESTSVLVRNGSLPVILILHIICSSIRQIEMACSSLQVIFSWMGFPQFEVLKFIMELADDFMVMLQK